MSGTSSHVIWRQPWSSEADSQLRSALAVCGVEAHNLPTQAWNPKTATISGIRDYKLCNIGPAGHSWSSALLHLNSELGESLARELSWGPARIAFLFKEYEQTTWGYVLFEDGSEADRFWSEPEELGEDRIQAEGDADIVAVALGIPASIISPYLELEPGHTKAYPDDRYFLDDHWVRVDFMRRIGIDYPNVQTNRWVYIREAGVNDDVVGYA
jgi:hypothetical protein